MIVMFEYSVEACLVGRASVTLKYYIALVMQANEIGARMDL
jgi:hypothetical protein